MFEYNVGKIITEYSASRLFFLASTRRIVSHQYDDDSSRQVSVCRTCVCMRFAKRGGGRVTLICILTERRLRSSSLSSSGWIAASWRVREGIFPGRRARRRRAQGSMVISLPVCSYALRAFARPNERDRGRDRARAKRGGGGGGGRE